MSTSRPVTERDFRMPEYKDADPKDYEFRDDGTLVRKDRWERGIRNIASALGVTRAFEVHEVVSEVVRLIEGGKP